MPFSSVDAYLLGSMPRRVFHTRAQSREVGDASSQEVRRLADQWLALLAAVKDQSIRPAVQALKDRLDLEQQYVDALKRHRRLSVLNQLTTDAPPLEDPPAAIPPAPDSLGLALALVDRPEHAQIREKLLPELREVHEMGHLVAECRWNPGDVDHVATRRVWSLARKWNVEEWVTGRAAGSPLEPHETIDRLVRNNAKEIDELFLTQSVDLIRAAESSSSPAQPQAIARSVVDHLEPRLEQIRNDIADYADASTADTKQVETAPRLMTPNEAADEFGVSASLLRREFDAGRIAGRKIGKHRKLDRDSIVAWCRSQMGSVSESGKPITSPRPKRPPKYLK